MATFMPMQTAPPNTTYNGLANQGSQIGHSTGSVTNNFYAGAIHHPLTPTSHVPFRRDRDFVDRPLLTEIWQRATQPAGRVGLHGLGGVGKTQLAIEYAYQRRDTNPSLWVFWVHASTATRFEESYRDIAQRLKLSGWHDPKTDVLPLVHAWLCDENNGQWAMVVDNADSTDVLFGQRSRDPAAQTASNSAKSTHSLASYLPYSVNGSIVITSRSREVVEGLLEYDEDILHVESMTVDEGAALFSKKLKAQNKPLQQGDLLRLVRELDCMPLAITQAASCINQRAPRMTASQYLEDLMRSDMDRTTLLEQALRDPRRDGQASNSIIATWHISFEHIRQTRDSAARLLSLMCLFDREAIPQDLLIDEYFTRDRIDKDDELHRSQLTRRFENDIATLRAYGLIRVGSNNKLFDMHRLVQFSTRRWLELHGELAQWQIQYAALLCSAFPEGEYANWPVCQALLPHMDSLMSYHVDDENFHQDWATVAFRGAWYMSEMGKYNTAERMARASVERQKQLKSCEPVELLNCMNTLALALQYQGKYEQAEELHREVLASKEKELGTDHPSTSTSISNLAITLHERGQYKQAEELHRKALYIRETELGVEHPRTSASMNHLATVLRAQGRYDEADELYRKALAIREKVLGANHPDTLTSISNLAIMLREQGEYKQAEELHRQALAIRQKELGINHPDTLASMDNLALTLWNQNMFEQAEELHRRVMLGSERELGPSHPNTLTHISNLSLVLQDLDQYEEAEKLNRRALSGYEKELGVNHPHTLVSVWCLANLFYTQQNYDDALPLYNRAVRGFTQSLGPTHPNTKECIRQREKLLHKMDNLPQVDDV